jgi:RNase P subunit RPR2
MRCRHCQRSLTGKEGTAWHKIKNADGRVLHLTCNKCFWVQKKKHRFADDTTPDAYQAAASADEEREERWSDWREPTEVEL